VLEDQTSKPFSLDLLKKGLKPQMIYRIFGPKLRFTLSNHSIKEEEIKRGGNHET
jgi:hypothetical protein